MHLRKINCKEHWIEVTQHTVQRRASMMDTLNFRREYHSVQVQAKSADKRLQNGSSVIQQSVLYRAFLNQRPLATDGNTA
jgi:hypothetical protein